MSSTVKHVARKSRLSLSLKKSNIQTLTEENSKNDINEKVNTCEEPSTSINDDEITTTDGDEEEEIIPCSQTEDKLVFSQKNSPGDDEGQNGIVPEQKAENSSSAETYFSDLNLEPVQCKDSSEGEDKVQDISSEIFTSTETKIFKILNEEKDSNTTEDLTVVDVEKVEDIQNSSSKISSSTEIDICEIDEKKDNEKMEWFSASAEEVYVQEESNEIPNSPEAKVFKILKENKETKESKCCENKHYGDFPPIIKRNIVIADSDEEFEEFAKDKKKSQKPIQNIINTINSQKENSMCESKTKVSSISHKEKDKVLKSQKNKSNVSKTSKEKSKSLSLKRKMESAVENSDDEFETPYKRVKKIESPQKTKKSKKSKKS